MYIFFFCFKLITSSTAQQSNQKYIFCLKVAITGEKIKNYITRILRESLELEINTFSKIDRYNLQNVICNYFLTNYLDFYSIFTLY